MVNGVSGYNQYAMNNVQPFLRGAAGAAVLHKNDIENMVKFMNGQPVVSYQDPTVMETVKSTIPMMGIFGAIQGGAALKKNGWSIAKTIDTVNTASPIKTRGQALSAAKNELTLKFKDLFKKNVTVSSERGFLGKILDKIPGYSKLRKTGFGQTMGKTGAGWMAVMDGAMETFTQVVPTFQQLGAKAGFKQIGKSAAKVGAGIVGWVGGDAIGRGLGAAIGTFICPGVGTAVGSFIGGFLGGMVGSAVAGNTVKKLTGKSELELENDKKIAETSQQVANDEQTKAALAQQTLEAANQVLAQDPENKDALAAKASAEKTLAEIAQNQQQAQAQQPVQAPVQQAAVTPQFQAFQGIPPVPGFNGVSYDMNVFRAAQSKAASIPMLTQPATAFNPAMANPFGAQAYNQAQYIQQPAVAAN